MAVLQGGAYPATVTAGDALTDPPVLTVTAPDGTTSTPTVTATGSTADAVVAAVQVGMYLLVWTGLPGDDVVQDQFTCETPRIDLISLTDLKAELHLRDTSKDARLREWLRAATEVIENVTGAILPVTKTLIADGGVDVIVLPDQRVSRIVSIVETVGTATTTLPELADGTPGVGYTWDPSSGVLHRIQGWGPGRFARAVEVTYVAGMTTVPADVRLAASRLIGHWYRKSESPFRSTAPFGGQPDDALTTVGNYMVPNEVMELLEPLRRTPGIA